MNLPRTPGNRRVTAMLRAPMAWIGIALLLVVAAATLAVAVELYASTAQPMVVNPR